MMIRVLEFMLRSGFSIGQIVAHLTLSHYIDYNSTH